jgi:hypothetical protein
MNLQAEAQLLCLEIGDGSRRLNKFGNKTRANMKSHICPVHICPLAYNYRNMDCSARLVLSLLAGQITANRVIIQIITVDLSEYTCRLPP